MSEFGDRTPAQDLYDWTRFVQDEFKLTDEQMVIVMQQVLSFMVDPFESKFHQIQKEEKKS